MESQIVMDMDTKTKSPIVEDVKSGIDVSEGSSTAIYIDPSKEAAAMRKFDMTVLPVSVIFLILSSLDRNNVIQSPRNPSFQALLLTVALS
jgi:hypothetical protein